MAGIYAMMGMLVLVSAVSIYYLARKSDTSTLTYVILYLIIFGLMVGIFSVKIHQLNEQALVMEQLELKLSDDEIKDEKEVVIELEGEAYIVEVKKETSGKVEIIKYEKMD